MRRTHHMSYVIFVIGTILFLLLAAGAESFATLLLG